MNKNYQMIKKKKEVHCYKVRIYIQTIYKIQNKKIIE